MPIVAEGEMQLSELSPVHFSELMVMVDEGKVGSRVAKDMLKELFGSDKTPLQIATDNNLLQMSDSSSLKPIIDEIIAENEAVVAEYKGGKETSLKFLLGQGMKKSKGSADPKVLEELLVQAMQ
jgi:aspartyl-tRNA(Asn)/glutamyl-tRNA(Gln) amidotransferase subunit B